MKKVKCVVRRRKWEIELYCGEYYHTMTITSIRKPKSTELRKLKFGESEIEFFAMDIVGIKSKAVRRKRGLAVDDVLPGTKPYGPSPS